LYDYLDGQLTRQRRILIQRHLDDCPPCLDAFDFEAELRVIIASKCREHVPEQLRLRVARAIREVRDGDFVGDTGDDTAGGAGPFGSAPF
jgi:mycothiol system anti-sigma-R factor